MKMDAVTNDGMMNDAVTNNNAGLYRLRAPSSDRAQRGYPWKIKTRNDGKPINHERLKSKNHQQKAPP
jgi:hypothetical protein